MDNVKAFTLFSASGLILTAAMLGRAADVILPGSTPQGDILRGEGVFLRGKGLYEYYSAKGRRIDAGTEIMIRQWNMLVYDCYKRERARHIQYRKGQTVAQEAAARKRMAEKEERLRTSPTDEDVVSGEALNALLQDLSDPTINASAWRAASVTLPQAISIRSLFFRFAPRPGDKNAGTLSSNLIALGRLDPSRGWPIFIPQDKVGPECRAYEATHRTLLQQCEKDALKLEAVTTLDAALNALKARVSATVPVERNFRTTAVKYVTDMQAATKIFDASTIDFVQEMIRDTHDYNPETVAELLAFLRKYRLFFASAEGRPEDGDVYRALFRLLREQKEKLGLPVLPPELVPGPPPEEVKFQGTWVLLRRGKDGKVTPGSTEPAKRVLLIYDKNRYVHKNAQTVFSSGTWRVDSSRTPRTIDHVGVTAKKEFTNGQGIYDWQDDNLRICWGSNGRPIDFKFPPGSARVVQVWARLNP
jgi:uncharacterized protein (TIGR03067 family)